MLTKEEEANPSGFKVVSDTVDPPNIEKLNTSGFKVVSDKTGPAIVDDLGPSVANEVLVDDMKAELLAVVPKDIVLASAMILLWLKLTKVVAEV